MLNVAPLASACTGWEMTVVDSLARNETKTSGTTRSTSYTSADGDCVQLTWKWSVEFKVVAAASTSAATSVPSPPAWR